MAYNSKNAFALLGDEDAPAPVAAKPTAAAPTAASTAAPARNVPGSGRGAPRGAAAAGAGGRGGARRNVEGGAAAGGEEGQQTRDVRDRKPRAEGERGRGRGRGGRGGRGRQFDRHSATGRVDSEKSIEAGWGGADGQRELKAEEDAVADAKAEEPEANGASTPAEGNAASAEGAAQPAAIPEEEEDNTKTYEEYLAEYTAQKAKLSAVGNSAGPRTVSDSDKWEGFGKPVVKSLAGNDDFYIVAGGNKSASQQQRVQRERKEKQVLEIEQTFNTPPVQRSGGRGGRGGARGDFGGRGRGEGRGRGGARGGRGRGAASGGAPSRGAANVNLNDQSAFPSLS